MKDLCSQVQLQLDKSNKSFRHCHKHHFRYMYIIFEANGAYEYGCGILETVIETEILPGNLSFRLIWYRFYNSHIKQDTNIPLDLQGSTTGWLLYISLSGMLRCIRLKTETYQCWLAD